MSTKSIPSADKTLNVKVHNAVNRRRAAICVNNLNKIIIGFSWRGS